MILQWCSGNFCAIRATVVPVTLYSLSQVNEDIILFNGICFQRKNHFNNKHFTQLQFVAQVMVIFMICVESKLADKNVAALNTI